MPSIDVILEQPDLVVLGGPTSVELQLDTGATGTRGSLIYVGVGTPSSLTIPNYSSILPGDLYINVAQGSNYSWLYQYLVKPSGNTWEPILALNPAIYTAVYEVEYTAGEATISIPIINISSTPASLTSDNFAINFNYEHSNPIAASIKTKQIVSGNLVLTFSAVEFNGTSWSALVDSAIRMALSIRVIPSVTVI